jgi:hypothetical protein
MKANFVPEDTPEHAAMLSELSVAGNGVGLDQVVTIPVNDDTGAAAYLNDLEVADLDLGAGVQAAVLTVGNRMGLVVADPGAAAVVKRAALPELKYGDAVAVATVNTVPYVIVGGTVQDGTGRVWMLSLAPLATGAAPLLLGSLDLPAGVSDLLIIGNVVIAATESGTAYFISMSDPTAPAIIGSAQGIGSRIVVDDNNILWSTARSFVASGTDPLRGLHATLLGKSTVITKVTESPVMLALDRKTIEPQTLRYKSIPLPEDVTSAEVELLWNDTVFQRLPAQLDAAGQGQVTVNAGFMHPSGQTVRARLVVKTSSGDDPTPLAKALASEPFVLLPDGSPEDEEDVVSTDLDDFYPVTATNRAILKRMGEDRDPPYKAPITFWRAIEPQPASYFIDSIPGSPRSGSYYGELNVSAIGAYQVELTDLNNVVLARSAPIPAVPGHAKTAQIAAGAPPQSPGMTGSLPADGKTEIVVTLSQVKDREGYQVSDGGEVLWRLERGDGQVLSTITSILDGTTSTRYRAGVEHDESVRLVAVVDDEEFAVEFEQAKLRIELTQAWPDLELDVNSNAGRPAPGTKVFWGTGHGSIQYVDELTDGVGAARWIDDTATRRPGYEIPRRVMLFAVVGNERAEYIHDFDNPFPPGLRLRWDRERFVFDAPPDTAFGAAAPEGAQGATSDEPPRIMAVVEGGQPGELVRLELGSEHHPVVEPIAAYALDSVQDGVAGRETEELYGNSPARVAPGVGLGSDPAFAHYLQLYGGGGLRVEQPEVLALRSEFGLTAWVRFDQVTAGQMLFERQGAYGVWVVEDAGQQRLEFFVLVGGVRKQVVSTEPLVPGTWYHVAAQLKGGRLWLGVGVDRNPAVADASGLVDATSSPLEVGGSLQGRLDEVAIYDLTREPFLRFADGTTQVTVALDDQGQVSVPAFGLTLSQGLRATAADDGPPIHNAFLGRVRMGAVRVSRAADPPTVFERVAHVGSMLLATLEECAQGLATGEPTAWAGFSCEIIVGMTGAGNIFQGARDLVFTGINFAKSKKTRWDQAKALFGVAMAAVALIPASKAVIKSFRAAGQVAEGTRLAQTLAKSASRVVAKELGEASEHVAEKALLDILNGVPSNEKNAILRFISQCPIEAAGLRATAAAAAAADVCQFTQFWRKLHTAGATWELGVGDLILKLDDIGLRYGDDIATHMLNGLHDIGFAGKLSDDAFEGMALLLIRAKKKEVRLPTIWRELDLIRPPTFPAALTNGDRVQVFENMFSWIKEGALKVPKPEGWDSFLAHGPGTSSRYRSTSGFYHHLQDLKEHGFNYVKKIDAPDLRYKGRPDILEQIGGEWFQRELKNLAPGKRLGKKARQQLDANVDAAIERAINSAAGDRITVELLEGELKRMRYVFRGKELDNPAVRRQIHDALLKKLPDLGPGFKALADRAPGYMVEFQGKRLPLP